uniref:Uncharacterized protein n=1 Tax=Oryza sativa subsp. japonica TaxID=39947 RepID=Q6YZS7_ORYSJ|nr:hypothetical protein [Oryza sativa Japonica Group]BAD03723.1 hypothetical protein [Oryza sativa Japonica Group]
MPCQPTGREQTTGRRAGLRGGQRRRRASVRRPAKRSGAEARSGVGGRRASARRPADGERRRDVVVRRRPAGRRRSRRHTTSPAGKRTRVQSEMAPSCDPNYPRPQEQASSGSGPYVIEDCTARCSCSATSWSSTP